MPIICLDEAWQHFAQRFWVLMSTLSTGMGLLLLQAFRHAKPALLLSLREELGVD